MGMTSNSASDNAMEVSSSLPRALWPCPTESAHLRPNWLSNGAPHRVGSREVAARSAAATGTGALDPVVIHDAPPPPDGKPQGRCGHTSTSSLRSNKPAAKKPTVATCPPPPPPSPISGVSSFRMRAVHFVKGGGEDSWVRSALVDGAWDRWLGNVVEVWCVPIA